MTISRILTIAPDNVMAKARNLWNMVTAQTPLLGDKNIPLHPTGASGTGFESATSQHQVFFTSNPLATPYRAADPSNIRATPREPGQVGATPLQTPMRDNLSINPDDGFSSAVQTPRKNRMWESASKWALWAGFMNLLKPENNFKLMVLEDEEDEKTRCLTKEEDAVNIEDKKLRFPLYSTQIYIRLLQCAVHAFLQLSHSLHIWWWYCQPLESVGLILSTLRRVNQLIRSWALPPLMAINIIISPSNCHHLYNRPS